MTAHEMAADIIAYVNKYDWTTFVELVRRLGADAEGDREIYAKGHPQIVLWVGVSDLFVEALALAGLPMQPASLLTYLVDGGMLRLPLARNLRPYKSRRWLPVCLRPRGAPDFKKERHHG